MGGEGLDPHACPTSRPLCASVNRFFIVRPFAEAEAMPGELDLDFPIAPNRLACAELRYRGTGQAREAAELLLPRVLEPATN